MPPQVHISQRVDRMLLLSVFEQGCQRLQVKMNLFGVVRDERVQEPKDSATLVAALAFLIPIAEMYMTGKLTKEQLIPYRNEALRSLKDKAGKDKEKGKNSGNKGKRKEKAKGKKEQGKHDEKDAAENYEKHAEEIKEKDAKENKEKGNNKVKGSNKVKGKNNVKGSNLMQRPAAARAREASAPALPTPPASLMEEALLAQLARE